MRDYIPTLHPRSFVSAEQENLSPYVLKIVGLEMNKANYAVQDSDSERQAPPRASRQASNRHLTGNDYCPGKCLRFQDQT